MNFRENLRLAFSCVKANKMRSVLTMLGIIIGISAVITISTIGTSLKQSIAKSLNDLAGVNTLYAYIWFTGEDYDYRNRPGVTLDILDEYYNEFSDDVNEVAAEMYLDEGKYDNGRMEVEYTVTGESGGVVKTYGADIIQGRDITIDDSHEGRCVGVVSDLFVKYALEGRNPIGEKVTLCTNYGLKLEFYIIGVYEYNITKMGSRADQGKAEKDISTPIYVPLEYVFDAAGTPRSEREVYFFNIISKPGVDPDTIIQETEEWFNTNAFEPGSGWGLHVESMEKQLSQITKVLNLITVAISIIAAISLIVGGIGVMNIMLVSVVERTKEIGIRKALGAKNKVIERQFLVEAVLICSMGGLIGILLGLLNGGLISVAAKYIVASTDYNFITVVVRPPIAAIVVSFVFSMLVGVIFGLYPARRAARLSPIDALRYE
jgi:putative ABC transport system permease protein